jgi:hypothetical protein
MKVFGPVAAKERVLAEWLEQPERLTPVALLSGAVLAVVLVVKAPATTE